MEYKFEVGQKVVYTNEFGVCFGVKIISALTEWAEGPAYHYEKSDAPWFPNAEERFAAATPEDLKASLSVLQEKYGRPTIRAERESLLDTDPWEGEG